MKALIFGSVALLSLSGCSSEVDKCVAEWEKANPGPDDQGNYCTLLDSENIDGKCYYNGSKTKAQIRAVVRMECLQASKQ
jgi:hypothetical protein